MSTTIKISTIKIDHQKKKQEYKGKTYESMEEEERKRAMPCQGAKASKLFGKIAVNEDRVRNGLKEKCTNKERHLDS